MTPKNITYANAIAHLILPFTTEQYVMDLFICAVNGNKDCIQAHDSLQTKFVTDGALSELYYELNGLLQIYKKRKSIVSSQIYQGIPASSIGKLEHHVLRIIIILTFLLTSPGLFAQSTEEELYMDAFIVIADTSQDYFELRDEMFDLSEKLQLDIDTMGRGYDKSKKLICLPDDAEDELYAGSYFPRRYPSETLSLEYLDYYINRSQTDSRTIALIATITDDKQTADSSFAIVKQYMDSAFLIQTRIYMGCMH